MTDIKEIVKDLDFYLNECWEWKEDGKKAAKDLDEKLKDHLRKMECFFYQIKKIEYLCNRLSDNRLEIWAWNDGKEAKHLSFSIQDYLKEIKKILICRSENQEEVIHEQLEGLGFTYISEDPNKLIEKDINSSPCDTEK